MTKKTEWNGIEIVKRDLTNLISNLEKELESLAYDDNSNRLKLIANIERAKHYFYLAEIMEEGMPKLNKVILNRVELA